MNVRSILKGKEWKSIYIAPFLHYVSHSARLWITLFYLQIHNACLSFVSVHQTAPPPTEVRDIPLQLTTHLSTPKGWQADLAWLVDLWRTVYPQLQVERRTRKFREVVCSCDKVSSVTGLSRYGTCCQHQLWRLKQSGHLRRDWMTGAWMWSSKRQLLSSFHYHYKLQVTSYKLQEILLRFETTAKMFKRLK